MRIRLDLSAFRRTRWHEYLARFVLGGAVTVITGVIAKAYGPTVGGLFLAFPAIFPASVTLLDKHEREKKRKAGIPDTIRGRQAVGLDARGAALGSIALSAFAFLVWKALPGHGAILVLIVAPVAWGLLAAALWRLRKLHIHATRRRIS